MSKTYKKELTAVNVFDAAMERFNTLYDRYDNVVVSFSGGKDSTVCLQLKLHTEYDGLIPAIASKIIYMREGLGYLREIQRRLATIVG